MVLRIIFAASASGVMGALFWVCGLSGNDRVVGRGLFDEKEK